MIHHPSGLSSIMQSWGFCRSNQSRTPEQDLAWGGGHGEHNTCYLCLHFWLFCKMQHKSRALLVNGFRRGQCTKHMIPQRRCYSEPLVLDSEVMVQMVFLMYRQQKQENCKHMVNETLRFGKHRSKWNKHLEVFSWIRWRLPMMQIVVCAVIHHITQQAASKHAVSCSWCSNQPD